MKILTPDQAEKCVPQNNPVFRKLIIFSHIPKTAGSALNRNLRANYKNAFCLHVWKHPQGTNLSDWIKTLNDELSQPEFKSSESYKAVLGHVGFRIHEFMDFPSCTYITLLRDPVHRVISHYYQLQKHGPQSCEAAKAARELELEAFVEKNKSPIVNNLQTRFISGVGWYQACNVKGWQQLQQTTGQDPKKDIYSSLKPGDLEVLELAKKNLDEYFVFGLQDRFSDSLTLFQQLLGWKRVMNLEAHVRSGREKDQISQAAIELIRERNQSDIALYEYAQASFDAQWSKCS